MSFSSSATSSKWSRYMPSLPELGYVSFVDWHLLMWSLGLTVVYSPLGLPMISRARLAMTSLAFMLVEVPAPPWIISTMNSLFHLPEMTSSQACLTALALSSGTRPSLLLAVMAAFFTIP